MKITKANMCILFEKIVKAIETANFYTWIKCEFVASGLSFLIQRENSLARCATKYRIILDDNISDFCVEIIHFWGDNKSTIYKALKKEFKEIMV